jgi:hypothetical protein
MITVSNFRGQFSHEETVAAAGVLPTDVILCSLAGVDHGVENCAELLDVVGLSAIPGEDTLTFTLSFLFPVSGPVYINWSAS